MKKPSVEVAPTALRLTYFQFPIQVCFSSTLLELVFPVSRTFFLLCPETLTYGLYLRTWARYDHDEPPW